MNLDTPHALMSHLVSYITDDRAIIAHLRREFGADYSIKDIQKARRENRPVHVRKITAMGTTEMSDWAKQARLSDARMVDKLARYGR